MCSVAHVSFHSSNGNAGQISLCVSRAAMTCQLSILSLLAMYKVVKRALHSLEHVSCLFLGSMETLFDSRFDAADDAPFIFTLVVVFHIFHGCAGKHSFRTPDRAAV